MKRKYILSFIIIAVVLMATVATVGIVAHFQLKDKSDDKYYTIGNAKILSIAEATNTETKLVNYAYTTNNTIYNKCYEYEINSAESVVSFYIEYLAADENFEITQQRVGEVFLNKTYDKDTLKVHIEFSQNVVEIELVYTYVE